MKTTFFVAVFLFVSQLGLCQSEKLLQGKVLDADFPIAGIDVINQMNSSVNVTDASGRFSIRAKAGDVLIFGGKNYITKKFLLTKEDMEKSILEVLLNQEVIALEEVEVTKTVDDIKVEMPAVTPLRSVDNLLNSPTSNLVYNGSIADGINFQAIGKLIGKLFKGKKDNKEVFKVKINDYISDNFDKNFFLKTLKLKEEEVMIFLEFCYADPKAATIADNNNILAVTDFLISKKEDFLKLKN